MDKDLAQKIKAAMDMFRQTPPEERFDELVKRGVIDENGRVLLKMQIPEWVREQELQGEAEPPKK